MDKKRHAFSWRFFRMGVSRGSRSLMGGVICAMMELPHQSHALLSCLIATKSNTPNIIVRARQWYARLAWIIRPDVI